MPSLPLGNFGPEQEADMRVLPCGEHHVVGHHRAWVGGSTERPQFPALCLTILVIRLNRWLLGHLPVCCIPRG